MLSGKAIVYLSGLAGLYALEVAAPSIAAVAAYPFLPLMATSVYCAIGVVLVWLHLNYLSWRRPPLFGRSGTGDAKKDS